MIQAQRTFSFAIAFAMLGFSPAVALAGMPPAYQLTAFASLHLQAISFFLMILLSSAKVIQWMWNGLRPTFNRLPRLSYWKAVGLVLLWGLLFNVVLGMISGGRELMTPGKWEPDPGHITYRLKEGVKP